MPDDFQYDVFLSNSSKDKKVVRDIAERLKKDGVKVWFDDWILKPGDSIPAKIEEGLEHSRVLVLCMSANAFGSDWAQLESGTFRFRDPLKKERRFLPLRFDDTIIKGSLAQFQLVCNPQGQPTCSTTPLAKSPLATNGASMRQQNYRARTPNAPVHSSPRWMKTCGRKSTHCSNLASLI